MTPARTDQMKAMLTLQPGIITNNRLGGDNPGDTYTSEQEVPPQRGSRQGLGKLHDHGHPLGIQQER